jgi:NTP pyrophosphatase (non-canonical NTP hydrolase)
MMQAVDLYKYQDFVQGITSAESEDLPTFIERLNALDANVGGPAFNVPLLITAGIGLGSEAGEFEEIVKKVLFQGKVIDDALVFHLKRELGDIMWYWINACRALNLDPNEVIAENVTKLESRYPGGEFDVFSSENREAGDL